MATFYLEYCYAPFRSRYGSDKDASIRPGSPPELSLHLLFYAAIYFCIFQIFFYSRQSFRSGQFLTIFKNGNCAAVCTLDCALWRFFQAESNISIFQIDKKFVELWNHLGHQMSTASRNTLLQVFQDKTNRILTPVVDKIINHSTKGSGFHILKVEF